MAFINDWIVAGINNPEFTNEDFASVCDMNVDNTQLLGVDDYLKSDYIRGNEYFKDENGNFDEALFRRYYAVRASDYAEFSADDFYKGPALDIFSIYRTEDTPVLDPGFSISRGYNPNRQRIGIEGINVWSDPTFSQRELAKQNKVYNTKKGEFEDWTVNDHALVSSVKDWLADLTKEPLVLATWDDDGTHIDPLTGIEMQHFKGEAKLNDKGTYYYETLGDRPVLGKEVLSVFDTLTVDGEGLNKYDFFDSNDLKKSVGGTIMKTVVSTIPVFIPYVGEVYSAVLIGKTLGRVMPMLSGMVTSVVGGETPQWAEKASAWSQRFNLSEDDYSRANQWAFANIARLIGDLATIYAGQQFISKGIGKLRGAEDYIANANKSADALFRRVAPGYVARGASLEEIKAACVKKFLPKAQEMAVKSGQLGRDVGLAYMALSCQSGVYDEMLQHGATKQEASAVALGAIVGMFSVDKFLHIGEIFYKDATGDATKAARTILRKKAGEFADTMYKKTSGIGMPERTRLATLISGMRDKTVGGMGDFAEALKYHNTTFVQKMAAGAAERVSEEMTADISKTLYELAGSFGLNTSVKDVGAWENAGSRYAMTAFTGALGSAVFYGKEILDRGSFKVPERDISIETLVRNGHADDLRTELDKLRKEGKLGSKKISGFKPEKNDKGEYTWTTTEKESESQNEWVYNFLTDEINRTETLLADNGADLTDDELIDRLVMSEQRFAKYEELKKIAAFTGYEQGYAEALNKWLQAEKDYQLSQNTMNGKPEQTTADGRNNILAPGDKKTPEHDKNEAKYKELRDKAKENYEEYISGAKSLDYTRMMAFAMDPELYSKFMDDFDIEGYFESKFPGRKISSLTKEEKESFIVSWNEHMREQLKGKLPQAYEKYKIFGEMTDDALKGLEERVQKYIEWHKEFEDEVLKKLLSIEERLADYDNWKVVNKETGEVESDELYAMRNTKMKKDDGTMETDAEFNKRRTDRMAVVERYNEAVLKDWARELTEVLEKIDYKLDPVMYSMISGIINGRGRVKDILSRKIAAATNNKAVIDAFKLLKNDLSNVKAVIDAASKAEMTKLRSDLGKKVQALRSLRFDRGGNGMKSPLELMVENNDVGDADNSYSLKSLYDDIRIYDLLKMRSSEKYGIKPEEIDEARREEFLKEAEKDNELERIVKPEEEVESMADVLELHLEDPLKGFTADERAEFVRRLAEMIEGTDLRENEDLFYNATVHDLYGNITVEDLVGQIMYSEGNSVTGGLADKMRNDDSQTINGIVTSVKNDPIYVLQKMMSDEVKNPIGELVSQVASSESERAGRGKIDLPTDVDKLFRTIMERYQNVESISEFRLDSVETDNAKKTLYYLDMLEYYIMAASSDPDVEAPIGHNKTINEFARKRAGSLREGWKELPEIRADYASEYIRSIEMYKSEIMRWLSLSESLQVDRLRNVTMSDPVFARAQYDMFRMISKEYELNGKKYNLLEGYEDIASRHPMLEGDEATIACSELMNRIYVNVVRIADENECTILDLVRNGKLLEAFNINLSEIKTQRMSRIDSMYSASGMGEYEKLMYVLTLLSYNPGDYYAKLRSDVAANSESGREKVVPIVAQEQDVRMVSAFLNGSFVPMFEYAISKMDGRYVPYMPNTIFIQGRAGVGKTAVVLDSVVRDLKGSGKKIIVAGPRKEQVDRMKRRYSLTDGEVYSFSEYGSRGADESKDLLGLFYEKEGLKEMREAYYGTGTDEKHIAETDYFTITVAPEDELEKLEIKSDKVKSKMKSKIDSVPDVILIDEATHMSVFEARLLAEAAKEKGVKIVMCGDPAQDGSFNMRTYTENIKVTDVFIARCPELTLSMRVANAQKSENIIKLRTLLDQLNELRYYGTKEEYNGFLDMALQLAKSIDFTFYNKDDLKGDMFVKEIDDSTIESIRRATGGGMNSHRKILFIGSSSSATLDKLRAKGIAVDPSDVMPLERVQGGEASIVVCDYDFSRGMGYDKVKQNMTLFHMMLQRLYTALTRAEDGTVYIDNGLSALFGENVKTSYTTNAPDIREGVGKAVENKMRVLSLVDTSAKGIEPKASRTDLPADDAAAEAEGAGKPGNEASEGKEIVSAEDKGQITVKDEPIDVNEKDFAADDDPDMKKAENEIKAYVNSQAETDETIYDSLTPYCIRVGGSEDTRNRYPIEIYGDYKKLSVEAGEEVEVTTTSPSSRKYTRKVVPWIISVPEEGVDGNGKKLAGSVVLRNLQALVTNNDTRSEDGKVRLVMYADKNAFEDRLDYMRSAVMYNHTYDECPTFIKELFSKDDFENGRVLIEFRQAGHVDKNARPLGYSMDDAGMDFSKEGYGRVEAALVFELYNRDGRLCRFDIGGLNDPHTLLREKGRLKERLSEKAAKLRKAEIQTGDAEQLDYMSENVDGAAEQYYNWFIEQLGKMSGREDKTLLLDATDVVDMNKTTWFVNKGGEMRLDGYIDLDKAVKSWYKSDKEQRGNTFEESNNAKARNRSMRFSKVYTYNGKDDGVQVFDKKLSGTCVVFVSSDKFVNEADLAQEYIKQKSNPGSSTPRVRMMVLRNYGIDIRQMLRESFRTNTVGSAGERGETRFPVRNNRLGIKMFVAMWNARASLGKFKEAYERYWGEKGLGFSEAQVEAVTRAYDLRYRGKSDSDASEPLKDGKIWGNDGYFSKMSAKEAVDKAGELLNAFNRGKDYLLDIPMFRLGYYRNKEAPKQRNVGAHVEHWNVDGSAAYDAENETGVYKNLVMIEHATALKYYNMLDGMLDEMCAAVSENGERGLGLSFMKRGLENDTPWDKNELIELNKNKKGEAKRSLSGITEKLLDSNVRIEIGEKADSSADDVNLAGYTKGDFWSYVPRCVELMMRRLYSMQNEGNVYYNNAGATELLIPYKITDKSGNSVKGVRTISLDRISAELTGVREKGIDYSLEDMMALILHGTTDNIHKRLGEQRQGELDRQGTDVNKERGDYILTASDAPYPDGIEVNADVMRVGGVLSDGLASLYAINTPGMFFVLDANMRSSGARIKVADLIGLEEAQKLARGEKRARKTRADNAAERGAGGTSIPEAAQEWAENVNKSALANVDLGEESSQEHFREKVMETNSEVASKIVDMLENNTADDAAKIAQQKVMYDIEKGECVSFVEYVNRTNGSGARLYVEGGMLYIEQGGKKTAYEGGKNINEIIKSGAEGDAGDQVGLKAEGAQELKTGDLKAPGGKTVKERVEDVYGSDDFKNTVDGIVDESVMEAFKKDMKSVLDKADRTNLEDEIYGLMNNVEYSDILFAISMADQELYEMIFDKMFEGCAII